MIDQKIILVDGRGIMRDLMMELSMQNYARELTKVGRFFDEHSQEVLDIINNTYLAELSQGKNGNASITQSKVHDLVYRRMCTYFPSMSLNDLNTAEQLIMHVVTTGAQKRIPVGLGSWDQCYIKTLSLDAHAIICTRQTNESPTPQSGQRVLIHPVNSSEFHTYS